MPDPLLLELALEMERWRFGYDNPFTGSDECLYRDRLYRRYLELRPLILEKLDMTSEQILKVADLPIEGRG